MFIFIYTNYYMFNTTNQSQDSCCIGFNNTAKDTSIAKDHATHGVLFN